MEPKRMADQIYKAEHERDELKRQVAALRAAITAALGEFGGHLEGCDARPERSFVGGAWRYGPDSHRWCSLASCHALRVAAGLEPVAG